MILFFVLNIKLKDEFYYKNNLNIKYKCLKLSIMLIYKRYENN